MKAKLRYGFIQDRNKKYTVKDMCRVLGVSESGYYRYVQNIGKPSKNEILSVAIADIFEEHPYNDNYGVRRVQLALHQRGVDAGIRKITTIMREKGWIHNRRRPRGLTKATTEAQQKENLIQQNFKADTPFSKILTDITVIQCKDSKLYISPTLDCYSGEILSLCMDSNMRKELVIKTVEAAAKKFPLRGAILHSDRGSQYTSDDFRNTLKKLDLAQSLSGVDHCYDNARMESFFATLKKELLYRLPVYNMPAEQVKNLIFRYVFVYYNRIRVYTTNPDGLPPSIYRIAPSVSVA